MDGLDAATAKAKKILGDGAKIPPPKGAIDKAVEESNKTFDKFDKARNELEDVILELVDSDQKVTDAIDQYRDVLSESDFELDPKKKDDAKKIADAKKILLGFLDEKLGKAKGNIKNERDLNKHLANIKNYKQST